MGVLIGVVVLMAVAGVGLVWGPSLQPDQGAGVADPVVERTSETPPAETAASSPTTAEEPRSSQPGRPGPVEGALKGWFDLEVVDGEGRLLRTTTGLGVFEGQGILVPLVDLNGAIGLTLPGSSRQAPLASELWVWDGLGFAVLAVSRLGPDARWAVGEDALVEGTELFASVLDGGRRRTRLAGRLERRSEGWMLISGGAHFHRFVFDESGSCAGLAVPPAAGEDTSTNLLLTFERVRDAWARRGRIAISRALEWQRRDAELQRQLAFEYSALGIWSEAARHFLAALEWNPSLRTRVEDPLVSALRLALEDALEQRSPATVAILWEEALDRLYGNAQVMVGAAVLRLRTGDPDGALALLERVRPLDLPAGQDREWEQCLRASVLALVDDERSAGASSRAVQQAERGLDFLPDDVLLLHALGYARLEAGDHLGAFTALQRVAQLDEGRARRLESLLERLQRSSDPATVAEILFDPREGGIFTSARLNDRVNARALIDTGATYTAISEGLVRALGIDTRNVRRRARVETASGTVEDCPVITLDVLDLGGAVQRDVDAIVMPLDGAGRPEALIGMNFLGAYEIGIDTELGKLWLTATDR